jgi:hypothetical protein
MGHVYDGIDERLAAWIAAQPMFFVGTAPLAGDGRVNVSPKGPIGTFRVLGPHEVAYLDYVGSGAETVAHLRENGRIVVMFCAFQGPPRIVRLHGHGEVLAPGALEVDFPDAGPAPAQRSVIRIAVERVSDSCGYNVPLMEVTGTRPHREKSIAKRLRTQGDHAYVRYMAEHNAVSIDGLPAVEVASPPASPAASPPPSPAGRTP